MPVPFAHSNHLELQRKEGCLEGRETVGSRRPGDTAPQNENPEPCLHRILIDLQNEELVSAWHGHSAAPSELIQRGGSFTNVLAETDNRKLTKQTQNQLWDSSTSSRKVPFHSSWAPVWSRALWTFLALTSSQHLFFLAWADVLRVFLRRGIVPFGLLYWVLLFTILSHCYSTPIPSNFPTLDRRERLDQIFPRLTR